MRSKTLSESGERTWAVIFDTGEEAMAGLKRFAVVLPTARLAAVNLEDRLGRASALEVCYFATVNEARTWLAEPFE